MTNTWKCSYCHGTGQMIVGPIGVQHTEPCRSCDGTGNAFVDGPAREYARAVDAINRSTDKEIDAAIAATRKARTR